MKFPISKIECSTAQLLIFISDHCRPIKHIARRSLTPVSADSISQLHNKCIVVRIELNSFLKAAHDKRAECIQVFSFSDNYESSWMKSFRFLLDKLKTCVHSIYIALVLKWRRLDTFLFLGSFRSRFMICDDHASWKWLCPQKNIHNISCHTCDDNLWCHKYVNCSSNITVTGVITQFQLHLFQTRMSNDTSHLSHTASNEAHHGENSSISRGMWIRWESYGFPAFEASENCRRNCK